VDAEKKGEEHITKERFEEIAKRHNVDGLTTGTSEVSMFSILEISKRLNLPFYATSKQLETINNKKVVVMLMSIISLFISINYL